MKKNIIANTFTPLYDELEDRIRLVINYQDIHNRVDFMITRNFILNLSPAAEEFISKHYENATLAQDNITVNSQKDTNQSLSQTDNVNLELFRTDEVLLLEVNFAFDINTKQTVLTLSSKNISAKAILDAYTMSQTFKVIKSAIPNIKWGISHHF
jgi:hypothetical protein